MGTRGSEPMSASVGGLIASSADYDIANQFRDYVTDPANWHGADGVPTRIVEHLEYTVFTVAIASAIALPVGLLIGHTGKAAFLAINLGNAARAIPTMGLLVLAVTWRGLGLIPVLIALVALAIPPILTATYAGIQSVEPATVDAARGMGLSERQVLQSVEIPIALPLILSGIRSATVQVIATATIAAYVALGGLGRLLIDGLSVRDYGKMTFGALVVAVVAIGADVLFALIIRYGTSPGLTGRKTSGASPIPSQAQPVGAASAA
jgi:osmoprotectant transport system permease protein